MKVDLKEVIEEICKFVDSLDDRYKELSSKSLTLCNCEDILKEMRLLTFAKKQLETFAIELCKKYKE